MTKELLLQKNTKKELADMVLSLQASIEFKDGEINTLEEKLKNQPKTVVEKDVRKNVEANFAAQINGMKKEIDNLKAYSGNLIHMLKLRVDQYGALLKGVSGLLESNLLNNEYMSRDEERLLNPRPTLPQVQKK